MDKKLVRPFLQWPGGKGRLISQLAPHLPHEVIKSKFTYIEPFVGGGAVLFWLLNTFPNIRSVVINDINEDLINVYRVVATLPEELIRVLEVFQGEYHCLKDYSQRKAYYLDRRNLYNSRTEGHVAQAALFILLIRICFNGVYRVNAKNIFNSSFGTAIKPIIYQKENILEASRMLQKVEILCGDFEQTYKYVENNTLVFFDPPYKPVSKTSSFTSYSKFRFNDQEQIRLRDYCQKLHNIGCKWMLCNSDIPDENFFGKLYAPFVTRSLTIRRNISSRVETRGETSELLITNYRSAKAVKSPSTNDLIGV